MDTWPGSQGGHESQRPAGSLKAHVSGWSVYKNAKLTMSRIYTGATEPIVSCSQGSHWALLDEQARWVSCIPDWDTEA